ncbi:MAG: DUF5610 domain-containing protein [Methylococcaceae bacterium]
MQQVTNNNSRVNSDSALKSRSNNISSQVENKETVKITALSVEQVKKQYNQSILESNLTVSLSIGNESMALLYRTAIDEVNIALEGELGENAIQEAYDSGLDITPEATAERIISMSTAFFSGYRDQNPEMSESEAVNKFSEIIAGGIETGFSQARGVLDGLKVLEGDIADNIDVTYGLVQQGLQAFVESFLEAAKTESSEEESA